MKDRGLWIIILGRAALVVWFMAHTPLWHGDEAFHFQVVSFIVHQGRLPTQADIPAEITLEQRIFVQVDQPPLYYLLLAPFVAAASPEQAVTLYPSPPPMCGLPYRANFLQRPEDQFPGSSGTARAGWVARMVTAVLGLGAVAAVWTGVRRISTPRTALIASAMFAFWPPTVEFTSWITNDSLVLCLGGVLFALLCEWSQAPRRGVALMLILVSCLAVFTKLTAVVVIPVVATALWSRLPSRGLRWGTVFVVGACILAFLVYNLVRCGLPYCRLHFNSLPFDSLESFIVSFQVSPFSTGLTRAVQTLSIPWIAAVATPPLPLSVIGLFFLALTISAAGYAFLCVLPRELGLTLVALMAGAFLLGLARIWWIRDPYFHARYLAAALPSLAAGAGIGVARMKRWSWCIALAWGGIAMITPLITYDPVYHYQPSLYEFLPASATPMNIPYMSGLTIGAYEIISPTTLRLYIKADRPVSPRLLEVSVSDAEGAVIERCAQSLGGLSFPPEAWPLDRWVVQDIFFSQRANRWSVKLYVLKPELFWSDMLEHEDRPDVPPEGPMSAL